jgi:chromate transporter
MLELFKLFLRLGCVGFGGPQAHIAMMEDECVARRRWLTPDRFAQGLALCNLLPGPASTQLAIWIGYERRKIPGAIISGLCFILPAFLMVAAIAALYMAYGTLPAARGFLFGVKPAVIAIVIGTCWRLWQPFRKDAAAPWFLLGSVALTLAFPAAVALVLLGASVIGIVAFGKRTKIAAVHLWPLFAYFFKTGALIFGGGLVLIPLLQGDIVVRHHWITSRQFIDAVAVGQLTPGPVVITSAFIGYLLAGMKGAVAAAAGMFLPSFLFVFAAAPFLDLVRNHPLAKAALRGLMPAVVGAIVAATVPLGVACVTRSTAANAVAALILAPSLIATIRYKTNAGLVVIAAGVVGLVAGFMIAW